MYTQGLYVYLSKIKNGKYFVDINTEPHRNSICGKNAKRFFQLPETLLSLIFILEENVLNKLKIYRILLL